MKHGATLRQALARPPGSPGTWKPGRRRCLPGLVWARWYTRAAESCNLPGGSVTAAEPADDAGKAACRPQRGWVGQQLSERSRDLGRGCAGGHNPPHT
jgi:hypothetical protein